MKTFPGPIRFTGILLNVKNYQKCVQFYSKKLGLPIREQKAYLTVFGFGGGSLLVEKSPKKLGWKNGLLRFNVPDVFKASRVLRKRGLKINAYSVDWGDIGRFLDPEGNRIELCKWK